MYKVECGKCNGTGFLRMYSGIAGGMCFACSGKGYIEYKNKPVKTNKYQISAIDKETNERIKLFWIKAKNEIETIKKAKIKLNGILFDLESIEISGVIKSEQA